jgi:hypothetical protein
MLPNQPLSTTPLLSHEGPYAGVTLQRASFVPAMSGGTIQYNDRVRVFLYKLVGSWGFSPNTQVWSRFIRWYEAKKADASFHPYVEGLKTTEWYKSFEVQGRWHWL